MVNCTFCGKDIEKGKGMTYVFNSGKIAHFCGTKCEKNQIKLKRKARNMKWTVEGSKKD